MSEIETKILEYLHRTCLPNTGQSLSRIIIYGLKTDINYTSKKNASQALQKLRKKGLVYFESYCRIWMPI